MVPACHLPSSRVCSSRSSPGVDAITRTRERGSASRSRAASRSATVARSTTSGPPRVARASCYGGGVSRRERVLIVDDDPGFREVWAELLGQDGFAIDRAGAVDDGFTKFERGGARIVILDLMLPPSGRPDAGAEL